MEETLISFELAKAAKDKGFDLVTVKYWANYYTGEPLNKWKLISKESASLNFMEYAAPTQSLLAKWLREKHKIFITISSNVNKDDDDNPDAVEFVLFDWEIKYLSSYTKRFEQEYDYFDYFNTYEEALESALGQALNYIVNE